MTGGAGFIGSHLVDELVKRNCEVTVIDNLSNSTLNNLEESKNSINLIIDSTTNRKIVEDNIRVDVVFHLASGNLVSSVKSPVHDLRNTGTSILNILESLKKKSRETVLVFASTGSIYGEPVYFPQKEDHPCNPTSPYGISKLAAEQYVNFFTKEYGLKCVSLRYYNVVGSRQNYNDDGGVVPIFIRRMLLGQPPIIEGDGTQSRVFTSVEDVVRANILAYEVESGYGYAFNIATDEVTTINDLANLVCSFSEKPLEPTYTKPRVGDIHDFSPDITLAHDILGYKPQRRLRDAIPQIMEWMKCELRS